MPPRGLGEVRSPEEDPGEADRGVGHEPEHEAGARESRDGWVLSKDALQDMLDRQVDAMQEAPDHERPGGPVPEAPDEHHDDEVDGGPGEGDTVPAQRNIKIVAQEGGQRDVPPAPEVQEANGAVGEEEIVLQVESQAERRPDRTSRVSREVEEDLAREGDDPVQASSGASAPP